MVANGLEQTEKDRQVSFYLRQKQNKTKQNSVELSVSEKQRTDSTGDWRLLFTRHQSLCRELLKADPLQHASITGPR